MKYIDEIEILFDNISAMQEMLMSLYGVRRQLVDIQNQYRLYNEDMLSAIESTNNLINIKSFELRDLQIQHEVYNIKSRSAA